MNLLEHIRAEYLSRMGVPLDLTDEELVVRIEAVQRAADPAANAPGRVAYEAPLGGNPGDATERAPYVYRPPVERREGDPLPEPEPYLPAGAPGHPAGPAFGPSATPARARTIAEVQAMLRHPSAGLGDRAEFGRSLAVVPDEDGAPTYSLENPAETA